MAQSLVHYARENGVDLAVVVSGPPPSSRGILPGCPSTLRPLVAHLLALLLARAHTHTSLYTHAHTCAHRRSPTNLRARLTPALLST